MESTQMSTNSKMDAFCNIHIRKDYRAKKLQLYTIK